METTTEPPTESPTDAPERLFKVTSTVTLRKDCDGRTRRHDGVPVVWEMSRSPEEAPFDTTDVVPEDKPRNAGMAPSLFTREEGLRFLEDLEEEWPDGEHRLESVPVPANEEHLRYGPEGAQGYIEGSGDLNVMGHCYLQEADREGFEEGDTLLVETTLELPLKLAERLDEKHDVARYLRKLEQTAKAVSEAPNPHSSFEPDDDLPF